MQPYCTHCQPENALQVSPDNPAHYGVSIGDGFRVTKVLICGKDVTRRCVSVIEGVEGYVDILNEPIRACQCGHGVMRQVLHGNVEVVIDARKERFKSKQEVKS